MTIHDHFKGSYHCIQCKGVCQLAGEDLRLTELVRAILETYFYRGDWLPSQIEIPLNALLGDRWEEFRSHAQSAIPGCRKKGRA